MCMFRHWSKLWRRCCNRMQQPLQLRLRRLFRRCVRIVILAYLFNIIGVLASKRHSSCDFLYAVFALHYPRPGAPAVSCFAVTAAAFIAIASFRCLADHSRGICRTVRCIYVWFCSRVARRRSTTDRLGWSSICTRCSVAVLVTAEINHSWVADSADS